MPNYSLVINSKFQPFSFERYIQPYQLYGQMYKEQEAALSELGVKTNIWDKLTEPGTVTHNIYSNYAKDLEQAASDLAKKGLSIESRQSLSNLMKRYAQDIMPIESAYKRREEQIAEQRKAGNSMIYDYNASTTSLDRYYNNPSLSYRSIDRTDLRNRAEIAYGKFKEQLRDFRYDPSRKLDKFHNTLLQSYGLSPEQATDFINAIQSGRLQDTDAALQAVYNSIYNGTGVEDWNNEEAKNAVMNTILEGVGAGIGKEAASLVEDPQAMTNLDISKQLAIHRATHPDNQDNQDNPEILFPRHWDAILDKDGSSRLQKIASTVDTLTTKDGNLLAAYFTKDTNPLKIYEEWKSLKEKYKNKNTTGNDYTINGWEGNLEAYARTKGSILMENELGTKAKEEIKKKYGVSNILTEQQYNALKDLGYDSSSSVQSMKGMRSKLNSMENAYMPSSLTASGYKQAYENVIGPTIDTWIEGDQRGMAYERTSRGRGVEVKPKNIFKESDPEKRAKELGDIAYDITSPGDILLRVRGRDIYVNPIVLGDAAVNVVKEAEAMIKLTSDPVRQSQIQDIASMQLREIINAYDPVRSTTSSKR